MELGENEKTIVLVVLIIALAAVAAFFIWQEREISGDDFANSLLSAEKVAVVMDLRGATPDGRDKIMNCGVQLAGSSGLVDKEKLIYAFEGDSCITSEENKTIEECAMDMRGAVILHVSYGNNTSTFFEKRAEIKINESYAGDCAIQSSQYAANAGTATNSNETNSGNETNTSSDSIVNNETNGSNAANESNETTGISATNENNETNSSVPLNSSQ